MNKNINKKIFQYFFKLIFIFIIVLIIASGNKKNEIVTTNTNLAKSVQSSRIIHEYNEGNIKKVYNTKEISRFGNTGNIEFTGTLTGYGPDCPGCGGILGCPPYQNVLNNNIYYKDKQYGKIRIVAADPSIPCGSIVKISNFKFIDGNSFYAIVLDRGSAIKGLTMDLLYPSEKDTVIIGRAYNINFKIVRWSW